MLSYYCRAINISVDSIFSARTTKKIEFKRHLHKYLTPTKITSKMTHICDNSCKYVIIKLHHEIYSLLPMCGPLDGSKLLAIHRLSQMYKMMRYRRKITGYQFYNPCHETSQCASFMKKITKEFTFGSDGSDSNESENDDSENDESENDDSEEEFRNDIEEVFGRSSDDEEEINVEGNIGENNGEPVGTLCVPIEAPVTPAVPIEAPVIPFISTVTQIPTTIPYNITIFTPHVCNEDCNFFTFRVPSQLDNEIKDDLPEMFEPIFPLVVAADQILGEKLRSFTYRSMINPHYTKYNCPSKLVLNNEAIRIKTFSEDLVNGKIEIINSNQIVISDTHITIGFSYPLKQEFDFEFDSKNSEGFTRLELIQLICNQYHQIYQTESDTATKHQYKYQTECTECKREKLQPVSTTINSTVDICSICHESLTSEIGKLPCNHNFHMICIQKWLKRDTDRKCPMCMHKCIKIESCEKSNCQSGQLTVEYTDIVPNYEHRMVMGGLMNRSSSDGTYGISAHDLGDLRIEELKYDPVRKRVMMFIGS